MKLYATQYKLRRMQKKMSFEMKWIGLKSLSFMTWRKSDRKLLSDFNIIINVCCLSWRIIIFIHHDFSLQINDEQRLLIDQTKFPNGCKSKWKNHMQIFVQWMTNRNVCLLKIGTTTEISPLLLDDLETESISMFNFDFLYQQLLAGYNNSFSSIHRRQFFLLKNEKKKSWRKRMNNNFVIVNKRIVHLCIPFNSYSKKKEKENKIWQ